MRFNPFRWLFGKTSKACPSDVREAHEPLIRDAAFEEGYRKWQQDQQHEPWIERLRHAFNLNRAGLDPQDEGIDFLAFRATNGFVIHMQNEIISCEEMQFLLDLLRDKVKDTGYRLVLSDQRTRCDQVIEKHYLKPPLHREPDQPAPQRYGNITLEAHFRKGQPASLRFMATHYEDRCYQPAEDISSLFERLVN